jgi:hypothetical protein
MYEHQHQQQQHEKNEEKHQRMLCICGSMKIDRKEESARVKYEANGISKKNELNEPVLSLFAQRGLFGSLARPPTHTNQQIISFAINCHCCFCVSQSFADIIGNRK